MFEYHKISEELLTPLPERTKNVIARRFGLVEGKRETLKLIGEEYKITRERVRQIERDGIRQVQKVSEQYGEVFHVFRKKIEDFGGIKREDRFLETLSSKKEEESHLVFLLSVSNVLLRYLETEYTYSLWSKDDQSFHFATEVIEESRKKMNKENRPLSLREIDPEKTLSEKQIISYLEISKLIAQDREGRFGLTEWPEINPRGIKDRAYLALKRKGRPLHFREVAELLGDNANVQTTHNELIKDPRFVLVGRGVYALSEWGYVPGEVREIIKKILRENGPLSKDEIINRVGEQRVVKTNTIIQNLSNKNHFLRTPEGRYTLA